MHLRDLSEFAGKRRSNRGKPQFSLSYVTQPSLILWSLVLFMWLASEYA